MNLSTFFIAQESFQKISGFFDFDDGCDCIPFDFGCYCNYLLIFINQVALVRRQRSVVEWIKRVLLKQ